MKKISLLLLAPFIMFASCDRPGCTNTDRIFDQYTPSQPEYRSELVKRLRQVHTDKLTYWIDAYIEDNSREYMSIYIQGDGLCAKGLLDITNLPAGNRLEHYKQIRGNSYSGAELRGLKYTIDSTGAGYSMIYSDVERIID